jgi:hypothetical protein
VPDSASASVLQPGQRFGYNLSTVIATIPVARNTTAVTVTPDTLPPRHNAAVDPLTGPGRLAPMSLVVRQTAKAGGPICQCAHVWPVVAP